MKKILLLILAIGLIFTLTACDDLDDLFANPEPQPPAETPDEENVPDEEILDYDEDEEAETEETQYDEYDYVDDNETSEDSDIGSTDDDVGGSGGVALGLTIELLEYEEGPGPLADLTFMHIVNLDPDSTAAFVGDTLMIRTFTPLRDVAVILTERHVGADEDIIVPVDLVGDMVNNFLPTEGFIIYSYISVGTMPNTAITFVDENEQRHFFFILQNQGYPETGDRYMLIEFQLQIESMPADWIAPW